MTEQVRRLISNGYGSLVLFAKYRSMNISFDEHGLTSVRGDDTRLPDGRSGNNYSLIFIGVDCCKVCGSWSLCREFRRGRGRSERWTAISVEGEKSDYDMLLNADVDGEDFRQPQLKDDGGEYDDEDGSKFWG